MIDSIGRLALRTEGDYWKAYYALHDTMEDALPLGSILIAAVANNEHRKAAFLHLMQAMITDIVESVTGRRPRWPGDPQPLPDAEAVELGHGALAVQAPGEASPGPGRGLIGGAWDGYAALLPADAPPVQHTETRRAFYAGAHACFTGFLGGLSEGEDSSEEDEAFASGIQRELHDFLAAVQAGQA